MKRFIILTVLVIGFFSTINGQTYYNMWRGSGDSGKPEWIANLSMRTANSVTGIEFTTANACRGFVNGSGKWGFLTPAATLTPQSLSNIINGISNLTLGVQGWACAEGISVRKLWDGVTTTLDFLSADGKSTVTSNGDGQGLHIRSVTGNKIYLYDKVYFDQYAWASFGPGKDNHPTIDNPNSSVLRIGSNGGIAFWGGSGVQVDNNPQFYLTETAVGANVPVSIKDGNISLYLGATADSNDAWIGTTTNQGLYLGTNNKTVAYLGSDNNIYVGLTDEGVRNIRQELKTKYHLFVAKGILSEDYSIAPKSSWSDFVFKKNYNLPKISEVATFIRENNHLPDVPSAKQVAEEGYSQHDMNKILLQKIEELTLYTIQQQKEIDALKTQLQESKK